MKNTISRLILFVALMMGIATLFAQQSPVKWSFKSVKVTYSGFVPKNFFSRNSLRQTYRHTERQ